MPGAESEYGTILPRIPEKQNITLFGTEIGGDSHDGDGPDNGPKPETPSPSDTPSPVIIKQPTQV